MTDFAPGSRVLVRRGRTFLPAIVESVRPGQCYCDFGSDQRAWVLTEQVLPEAPAASAAAAQVIHGDSSRPAFPSAPAGQTAPPHAAASNPPFSRREEREAPLSFTGETSEYFRIWIVNTLLSIVTLGVYSAWAKVRKKQYFYRNTWLDGSSFEYLADPLSILKGRIVMVLALGALVGSQHYSLGLYIALVIVAALLTPWVMVKALAFNAANSAYRNVRFSFVGQIGEAYSLYLTMALFYLGTCGIGYPYAQWRYNRFAITNHRYGEESFSWRVAASQYYRVYLIAFALIIPAYALLGVSASLLGGARGAGVGTGLALVFVALYAYFLVPAAYLKAELANLIYGNLNIGGHELNCQQRPRELIAIYLTNALAIIFSLGLMIPWAQIRLARYRTSCMALTISGSLDTLAAQGLQQQSALGDAATDLGDFDLGLGL